MVYWYPEPPYALFRAFRESYVSFEEIFDPKYFRLFYLVFT